MSVTKRTKGVTEQKRQVRWGVLAGYSSIDAVARAVNLLPSITSSLVGSTGLRSEFEQGVFSEYYRRIELLYQDGVHDLRRIRHITGIPEKNVITVLERLRGEGRSRGTKLEATTEERDNVRTAVLAGYSLPKVAKVAGVSRNKAYFLIDSMGLRYDFEQGVFTEQYHRVYGLVVQAGYNNGKAIRNIIGLPEENIQAILARLRSEGKLKKARLTPRRTRRRSLEHRIPEWLSLLPPEEQTRIREAAIDAARKHQIHTTYYLRRCLRLYGVNLPIGRVKQLSNWLNLSLYGR